MTNEQLFEKCLEVARRITEAEKLLWPGADDVVALKVSGGVSNTDSSFERQGTTANEMSYSLPSELSALLNANAQQASPNASLGTSIGSLLASLVSQDQNAVPSKASLDTILGLSPTSFDGANSLRTIANRDPYSSQYETSTEAAYQQRAKNAMAQAQTGQAMVRGGTARPAIAQAELSSALARDRGNEIRSAQQQDAGQVFQASQLLNLMENARRGLQLQAQGQQAGQTASRSGQSLQAANVGEMQKGTNIGLLQLASNMLGKKTALTTDNLQGKGTENRSFVQGEAGTTCCFILATALNGALPWYVNEARRDYLTSNRKSGYKWMASWLVPAMQKHASVMRFVNATMVQPFLRYGRALYGDSHRWTDWAYAPLCEGWLATWSVLGTLVNKGGK